MQKSNLFSDYIKELELNNPKFSEAISRYDWRIYVPQEWQINWDMFNEDERLIIATMADAQAVLCD